jgi:hypothetical protein
MSELRLDLFDRRFDDLVETGHARIPNLAPGWTDHNLHDPGITLMELLAWTAEAQIYALSRQRKDERFAYAAMLGVEPRGAQPASGLLWPVRAPLAGSVIGPDTAIGSNKQDAPLFWPRARILLAPAQVESVRTLLTDGSEADHTGANRLGGAGFEPFGPAASRSDVLAIGLRSLSGPHLPDGANAAAGPARLSLGVRIAGPLPPAGLPPTPLRIRLVTPYGRSAVEVEVEVEVEDGTEGFSRSGAILLDLGAAAQLDACTLKIMAPGGFVRAPRVEYIALNVLPVEQSMAVVREEHLANGMPDQLCVCDQPGLQFEPGTPAVEVWTVTREVCQRWSVLPDLDDSGPDDQHVMLDKQAARLVFGNGVNGMRPAAGATVLLSYRASAGIAGSLPHNLNWLVPGFDKAFFSNLDPMTGGADARTMDDLRRGARRSVRTDRALVTAKDVAAAALDLADLGVARAEVLGPDRRGPCRQPQGSTLTLVALRARAPGAAAEGARWLQVVRARLAARMPLGTRLRVVAPHYQRVRVNAQLVAAPMHDPATVEKDVRAMLAKRLALTAPEPDGVWPFGAPLSATYVAAWLSKVPGVARVNTCELLAGDSSAAVPQAVPASPSGLLELDLGASVIDVRRSGSTR